MTNIYDIATGEKIDKKNVADKIVSFATQRGVECFHTPDGDAYARYEVDGHFETWPLGTHFTQWLANEFYTDGNNPPSSNALGDALRVLKARAMNSQPAVEVFTRVARLGDTIYLDLADERWRAVRIDASGWDVIENPPVRFRRSKGMLALPEPERAQGGLEALRALLNVKVDKDWVLIVAWLLMALSGTGPYPILELAGGQGRAKSTTTRLLRSVVDPSALPIRAQPKEERDLAIAAKNGLVLAYDNLSYLPDWLSDAFCRLATGGGFATRALYTDEDEQQFYNRAPVIMNGINEVATRGDLLSRVIVATLPEIPEDKRRTEDEVDAGFAAAHPRILGALLDAVSGALRSVQTTRLERLPRMADFAKWVTAAEPALGWERGTFMRVYDANRDDAVLVELESSLVAQAVIQFAQNGFRQKFGESQEPHTEWMGTASDLLSNLKGFTDDERAKGWPTQPNALTKQLRRLEPALRHVRVEVAEARTKNERRIILRRIGDDGVTMGDGEVTIKSASPSPEIARTDAKNGLKHPAGDGGDDESRSPITPRLSPESRRVDREVESTRDSPSPPSPPSPPPDHGALDALRKHTRSDLLQELTGDAADRDLLLRTARRAGCPRNEGEPDDQFALRLFDCVQQLAQAA